MRCVVVPAMVQSCLTVDTQPELCCYMVQGTACSKAADRRQGSAVSKGRGTHHQILHSINVIIVSEMCMHI